MSGALTLALTLAAMVSPSRPASPVKATPPEPQTGVAYFSGGCQADVVRGLVALPGVLDVQPGAMSEAGVGPASHRSTGVPAVRVTYQADRMPYDIVARRFVDLVLHGTPDDESSPPVTHETAVLFVSGDGERKLAHDLLRRLALRGLPLVASIRDARTFRAGPATAQGCAHDDHGGERVGAAEQP